MIKLRSLTLALAAAMLLSAALAATALASPVWRIDSLTNSTAAAGSNTAYLLQVRAIGDAPTDGSTYTLRMTLPEGMSALDRIHVRGPAPNFDCTGNGPSPDPHVLAGSSVVTCTGNDEVFTGTSSPISGLIFSVQRFEVAVDPSAAGVLTPTFEIWGGGASTRATGGTVCQSPATDEPCAITAEPTIIGTEPAEFGPRAFDVQTTDEDGQPFTQAGGHPDKITTQVDFPTYQHPKWGIGFPVEGLKDLPVETPLGVIGNPAEFPQCTLEELSSSEISVAGQGPYCPQGSQIGTATVRFNPGSETAAYGPVALFNMVPSLGVPARFGFEVAGVSILLDAHLRSNGDYGITVGPTNAPLGLPAAGSEVVFWGTPGNLSHDAERACSGKGAPAILGLTCPSAPGQNPIHIPFLRNPTNCSTEQTGLPWTAHLASWAHPARLAFPSSIDVFGVADLSDPNWKSRTILSHEGPGYPFDPNDGNPDTPAWGEPIGINGCEAVPVRGTISAQPTTQSTETPSGLKVHVEVPNPGLENPNGIASSDIKKIKVALPEGLTINPSQAEGLGVCSQQQYESEELRFFPKAGTGCPADSKIGSVVTKSPLLDELLEGAVYIAKPYENPAGSLLALYVVIKNPQRGVLVKLAGKVETNERTGQIVSTFDGIPQIPFSWFDLKLREGARSPLATPRACGTYTTRAEFTGHSDPTGTPMVSESDFQITSGIGGAPCPGGGLPPFKPGLDAGMINPIAGAYSPFNLRLFRTDAEQEMTHFSIKLPPGLLANISKVGYCPDAAIEAAKHKTGAQELASPSCPANSYIGRTMAGAGVGSVQTYAPGKIFYAGPYNGNPISIAAITAAKVGPFDLGTVVVRAAIDVNPETGEIFIDSTGSDPIPHLIKGITTHLRDIRVYNDRPEFTLNPTSCDRTSVASTVMGAGLDFTSKVDDRPVTVSTPFQVADCAALGFKPSLKITLKGATKRAGHPALRAEVKMRRGESNISAAQVTLPRSAFLDQSHIGTVCTRVQFKAGEVPGEKCPQASIYGYAKATTPILYGPIEGPVFLRSSEHKLPDLVAALHAQQIDINVIGRIDSLEGRLRSTFESVPDAPVDKFVLTMRGGRKGLLENSTNLCKGTHRAIVKLDAHNGKVRDFNPAVKADCRKGAKRKGKKAQPQNPAPQPYRTP
jgi:hypothetical protein